MAGCCVCVSSLLPLHPSLVTQSTIKYSQTETCVVQMQTPGKPDCLLSTNLHSNFGLNQDLESQSVEIIYHSIEYPQFFMLPS